MSKVYLGYEKYGLEGVDIELVQFVFDVVVSMTGLDEEAEVGLVLTDDKKMQELNKHYRNQDKTTNVLSFGYAETVGADKMPNPDKNYLGDIYMSYTQVTQEAHEMGVSVKARFIHLFVHGLLHLSGIHHDDGPATKRMEAMEDKILAQIASVE